MLKKSGITVMIMCFFTVCVAAMAIDVTGKWNTTLNSQDGSINLLYTFKADGDKLTGTVSSGTSESTIDNGQIKGSEISFTVNRGGEEINNHGTVYKDSIGLDVENTGFKIHLLLKRDTK
jgi:hypothetical protein